MFKKVIVTGSLAYDYIMSMPGRFRDHILADKLHILNVSFIMDTFRREFGGTGGNISYTLGLFGIESLLVGSVGKDFSSYRKHLEKIKEIDLSAVREFDGNMTARGFVTTDKDDNQIWGFYEGAMKNSRKISLKNYLSSEVLVMIAPNDPVAMIKYASEAFENNTPYIFDPAFNIPHFDLGKLMTAIRRAHILIGNDYEVELIKRRLKLSHDELTKKVNILITTLGPKGARIESKKKKIVVLPAKPKNESDPTGAGDAFRAGFLAGYVRDLPLSVCGRMGALSAVYTVEKYGTQTHKFSLRGFAQRYKTNFGRVPNLGI
jgi:adenosine kinase